MDRKYEQNQTQLVDLQNYSVYMLGKEMDELFILCCDTQVYLVTSKTVLSVS